MKLGILETGRPPEHLQSRFADYPTMTREMLDVAGAQLEYQRYAALDGELPADVSECDAWLLTGSKFAAYESDQWIADLKDFVRHAFDVGTPLLGICFGHQLMAAALGGEVRKSEKGWGVGVHRYELNDAPAWLGEHPDTLAIQAFHQDQVTLVPPDATVLARSDFCEVAALGYGDQALSVQAHPEFHADYTRELLELRRDIIGDERVDPALDDLEASLDSPFVARWFNGVLARAR